jgi:hypothetical protein
VTLNFTQEAREADFRYGLVRVRENAESIAFYGGSQDEKELLKQARGRAAFPVAQGVEPTGEGGHLEGAHHRPEGAKPESGVAELLGCRGLSLLGSTRPRTVSVTRTSAPEKRSPLFESSSPNSPRG